MGKDYNQIIVTTGDLRQDYVIIGPVYFQVSNKGIFGSALSDLKIAYRRELENMKRAGTMSQDRADWGFLYGEWSVGQNDFEAAFYIATQELKHRAARLDADAIICMRQDIDMDTNGFSYFYLQMYGTAVKYTKTIEEEKRQQLEEEKRLAEIAELNRQKAEGIRTKTIDDVKNGINRNGEKAVYPLDNGYNVTCPLCYTKQVPGRKKCFNCGTPFMY